MWKRTDRKDWAEYYNIMKNNDSRKKEKGKEEKWYARIDEMEAVWKAKIAETRLEYLKEFFKVIRKRSGSESI